MSNKTKIIGLALVAAAALAAVVWGAPYQTITVFDYSAGTAVPVGTGVPYATQSYGGFMYPMTNETAISNLFGGKWLGGRSELTNSRVVPASTYGLVFGYRVMGNHDTFTLSGSQLTNMNVTWYSAGNFNKRYWTNPIVPNLMITNRLTTPVIIYWVTNYLDMGSDGLMYTFTTQPPYPGMPVTSWATNASGMTNYLAGPTNVVWKGYQTATNMAQLNAYQSYDGSNWVLSKVLDNGTNAISSQTGDVDDFSLLYTNLTVNDYGWVKFSITNPMPNYLTQMFLRLYHK